MTPECLSPPARTEIIENLVSGVGEFVLYLAMRLSLKRVCSDRYNPANVNILEDYLYLQLRTEQYDCLANLAILKLFALFPWSCLFYFSYEKFTDINSIPNYITPTSS